MLGGYWYIEGADGRHYCYAKEPSFVCPIGSADRLGDLFDTACEEAGISKEWMLRRLRHNGYRARVNDRLTDRCESCGHKLDRLGFRCWIEEPYTREDLRDSSVRVTVQLNKTLSGNTPFKTVKSFHLDTKREAQRWAREEVALTKAIKEEEVNG